jgi:hypothetical protein
MKNHRMLLAALLGALSLSVWAQTPIDQRQDRQQRRIMQGVQSGELTAQETQRLEKGQAHVQAMESHAAADGVVTTKEAKHINAAQNRQSKHIAKQKHDKQRDLNHDGLTDRRR